MTTHRKNLSTKGRRVGFSVQTFRNFPDDPYCLDPLICVSCGNLATPYEQVKICRHDLLLCSDCVKGGKNPQSEEGPDGEYCCLASELEFSNLRFLEKFFMRCYWSCTYSDKGCDEEVLGYRWKEHVENCKFRPGIKCHHSTCEKSMYSIQLRVQHLIKDHHYIAKNFKNGDHDDEVVFRFDHTKLSNTRSELFKAQGKYYLLACKVAESTGYFWVWDLEEIEPKQESGKDFTLAVIHSRRLDGEHQFKQSCIPYWKREKEIIESGDYFALPLKVIQKNYLHETIYDGKVIGVLKLKLTIKG